MRTELGKRELDRIMRDARAVEAERATTACDLKRIERALERIAEGDYGYCVVCGDALGLETLERDPAADACAACEDG